jgi:hypothetical protein
MEMPTRKAIWKKFLELIPPNISTYNALDCEIHETFVWVYAIDLLSWVWSRKCISLDSQ